MVADKKQPSTEDRLAEILSQMGPPPTSGGTQTMRQIGPPPEFYGTTGFQRQAQPGFVPHTEADLWLPQALPSETRARLKAKMNAIGLYGDKGYLPGAWSGDDASAWQSVLETANAAGIVNPEEALDVMATEAAVKSPKVKAPRSPLVTRLTNPQSIRLTVQDSARKILGQALPDDQVDRIMSAYQAYEAQFQRAAYAMSDTEATGGTVTEPMTPEEFAQTEVERVQPVEAGSQRYLDAFDRITKSLGTMVQAPDLYGGS